ncbi:MAG: exodeoxyribonuclease III [Actinobacteria bacterium]|nr:exodeoxyribonuclease III [Actinomycetota bacterium]
MLRVATWNVNSLKARLPRVEEWLATVQPDVLCMQETKLADSAFPAMAFQAIGYDGVHYGEGRWNGVAILSRVGIDDVTAGFSDGAGEDAEARLLWATCGAVRIGTVYVPNGREVGHDMYHYKLRFLERMRKRIETAEDPSKAMLLCGDFNIAPDDRDVYDPAMYVNETHVTPPERQALRDIEDLGFVDVFRQHFEAGGLFSWWDYRAGNFHKGKGMRIDLMLASMPLAERSTSILIDRNARKGKAPSDHAPVVADFAIESV